MEVINFLHIRNRVTEGENPDCGSWLHLLLAVWLCVSRQPFLTYFFVSEYEEYLLMGLRCSPDEMPFVKTVCSILDA